MLKFLFLNIFVYSIFSQSFAKPAKESLDEGLYRSTHDKKDQYIIVDKNGNSVFLGSSVFDEVGTLYWKSDLANIKLKNNQISFSVTPNNIYKNSFTPQNYKKFRKKNNGLSIVKRHYVGFVGINKILLVCERSCSGFGKDNKHLDFEKVIKNF